MLDLSVADMGAGLRRGDFTALELCRAHLDRIALVDPTVRAFWVVLTDRALSAAATADADLAAGVDHGPLQGIPFAIKDTVDVAGVPTTCGSAVFADRVAAADAAVVAKLCAAGAVPLGKVATYDMGTVGPSFDLPHPAARNPWNPDHITGGSSSGSAAAVAAGMVRVAIGSDTAGSIRSPSAYCGCVGIKPTYGSVPTEGVFSLAPSFDTIGPIGASVLDAALMLDGMNGGTAASMIGHGVSGLRIGYARDWFAHDPQLDPAVLAAMDDAASALSLLGARITEVTLPDYALMEAVGAVMLHVEGLALHHAAMRDPALPHGRKSYQSLAAGIMLTDADRTAAQALQPGLRTQIDTVLAQHDAIITVTTLTTAPPFSAFGAGAIWTPMRTLPFNVTGHPVLSLPIGFADGLPVGMQIISRMQDEAMLCRIGAAFEAGTDHNVQRLRRQTKTLAMDMADY